MKAYGPVHIAVNGREAVEAVRLSMASGEPYNLICLDIMMPEMDGHEALRQIREREVAAGIMSSEGARVVMTTALADPKSVLKAFGGLCDAYLNKPIQKARLLEELRKLNLIK